MIFFISHRLSLIHIFAELLDSCAEKFNINIDDDSDIPAFVTVGDIVEFMEKNK